MGRLEEIRKWKDVRSVRVGIFSGNAREWLVKAIRDIVWLLDYIDKIQPPEDNNG